MQRAAGSEARVGNLSLDDWWRRRGRHSPSPQGHMSIPIILTKSFIVLVAAQVLIIQVQLLSFRKRIYF